MPLPRLRRSWSLCGVAYTVLLVLAASACPMPPHGDASPGRSPAWLMAHQTPVAVQGYVRAVAALAFAGLAVAVALRLRDQVTARVALGGGLACALLLLLSQAAGVGAVIAAGDHAGPAALRALGSLQDGLLALSALPAVALFGAAGRAFLRDASVPAWLAWLTLAGVPLGLLDAGSFRGSPLDGVGVLGLAFFLVWSLATGITLARPRATAAPVESLADPA